MTTTKKDSTPEESSTTETQIIKQETQIVNDYDIDGFLAKRTEFIKKVNSIMVEKADYHVIQGKKSLAKGGAEKIASIFGWQAEFTKDGDVIDSFKIEGLIAYACNLSKVGTFVGQGRGAATLQKNSGDPNKTIKMAQKSAFIDAVLRASGLSDFFTQDLEDMSTQQIESLKPQNNAPEGQWEGAPKSVKPASVKQLGFIKGLLGQKGIDREKPEIKSKLEKLTSAEASAWIEKLNSMEDSVPTIQIEEVVNEEIK